MAVHSLLNLLHKVGLKSPIEEMHFSSITSDRPIYISRRGYYTVLSIVAYSYINYEILVTAADKLNVYDAREVIQSGMLFRLDVGDKIDLRNKYQPGRRTHLYIKSV